MLKVTSPAPRDVWLELAEEDRQASVFQTPEWVSCICEAGGYVDASRLYHTSSGRQLVLPMVRSPHMRGRLAREASLPRFWGTGGVVSKGDLHDEDVADVFSDLASTAGLLMSLRPHFTQAAAWEKARPAAFTPVPHLVHVLALDGGFGRVWQERFDRSARGGVRKAERMNLRVEVDTSGRLIPQFYDLYLRWHERRARDGGTSPVLARHLAARHEPMRKFTTVARRLQEACSVWVAWHEGVPIASVITLVHGDHSYYWRGFSDRDAAARTRVNDLLQSLIIEESCAAGRRYYNMGESGGVASLMDFKRKFGAQPTHIQEFRYERFPFSRLARWEAAARHSGAQLLATRTAWRLRPGP